MGQSSAVKPPRVTAVLFVFIGLYFALGGVWLLTMGGSPYYAVAGLATVAAGVLLWRGKAVGATLFQLTAIVTVLWAIWEVGIDLWALAPRTLIPVLLAIWLAMPWVRRRLKADGDDSEGGGGQAASWKGAAAALAGLLIGVAALGASGLWASEAGVKRVPDKMPAADKGDWAHLGNDAGGSHYSRLDQINEHNVKNLQLAWEYHTGEEAAGGSGAAFQTTPIEIDDTLYLCTPRSVVIALDAVTGKERWRFDPKTRADAPQTCRGVSYHARADAGSFCARRILAATPDAQLIALDAATGQPCADFGARGALSLLERLGKVEPGSFAMTAPPLVVADRIVVGGWVKYTQAPNELFGVVRAFDVRSGKPLWSWDMGRSERGAATSNGAPTAEPWAPFAADPQLRHVYVPTGNGIPDFVSGKRPSYTNSIVALDLDSGAPEWSFQTVHADRWNSDLVAQPALVSLPSPKGPIPALVQATKAGQVFVVDRRDGKKVVDIAEARVPAGAGSATQPVSKLSVGPKRLEEADMWGLTPFDQLVCRIRFRQARYDGPFTPPGKTASIAFPGHDGVIGWGGVAVDQVNKLVVAQTSAVPSYVDTNGQARPFTGPLSVPCTRPPWGHLHLIDLKTDKHAWTRVVGTAQGSAPLGLFSVLPFTIGAQNEGGVLVTRGALIFTGATSDGYFRAYNLFTGHALWETRLPAGGQAPPMTYATRDGRQFVAIAAGGREGFSSTGDSIVAYTLRASR